MTSEKTNDQEQQDAIARMSAQIENAVYVLDEGIQVAVVGSSTGDSQPGALRRQLGLEK